MKKLSLAIVALLCFATQGSADVVYFSGELNANSPTFDAPGATSAGSGLQYYAVTQFTVDVTGAYTFESSSLNTQGTPSNALDTYLVLYANSFDPNSPGGQLVFNDDFTGTLTVLPGPFSGNGLTSIATGFSGAQPSSRIADFGLTAGTQYFLINSSFRDTNFLATSGTTSQAVGTYYTGISGPGIISVIPEPSSLALLGLAGLGFVSRRRLG